MYINLNNQFKIIYRFYLKYYDSEKVEKSIRERRVNKEDLIEDNRRKTNLMFLSLYREFEKNQDKIRDLEKTLEDVHFKDFSDGFKITGDEKHNLKFCDSYSNLLDDTYNALLNVLITKDEKYFYDVLNTYLKSSAYIKSHIFD